MSNYENEREKLNFPTYIIAAEWALRTGNLLTVDVLMNEFSITQDQANDIIYKIRNEGRCVYEKVVVFKSRPKSRYIGIKIFKVKPLSDMKNQEGIKIKELKDNLKIIRKWMLIRKVGDKFSLIEKYLSNQTDVADLSLDGEPGC